MFNGDIGFVTGLDLDANEIVMDFDARPVVCAFGELDEVMLSYAVSIHKSQGGMSGCVMGFADCRGHEHPCPPAWSSRDARNAGSLCPPPQPR